MKRVLFLGTAAMFAMLAATSQARPPVGASNLANAVPAAKCGPGYTVENLKLRDGIPNNYACIKKIPDLQVCNAHMQRVGVEPKRQGNQLELSYTCLFPAG
jgi:hypothetical protein